MSNDKKQVDDGEGAQVQTPQTADATNPTDPPNTDPGTIHSDKTDNPPPPEQP